MRKGQPQRLEFKKIHQPDEGGVQIELDKNKAGILSPVKSYEAGYLWCDRRSGFDRRQLKDRRSQSRSTQGGDRCLQSSGRRQSDRRCPENLEVIAYRRARTRLREQLQAYHSARFAKRRITGGITAMILIAGMGILLLLLSVGRVDCNTLPRPGVNWSNCPLAERVLVAANLRRANLHSSSLKSADLHEALLISADLTYANLAFANLRYADLSGATLRGANLRGADLGFAKLNNADLSYADLSGTNLEEASLAGTKLGYAIWPDRQECAPSSIEICR